MLITDEDVKKVFRRRPKDCHKGSFGYIALVGGSLKYPGAIRLAAMANCAMRAGAGVAAIAAPKCICHAIIPEILESTLLPLDDDGCFIKFNRAQFDELMQKYAVTAFGMGIGNTEQTKLCLDYLLKNYGGVLIIDADGLNALSEMDDSAYDTHAKLILTPHPGEFERLSGIPAAKVKEDPRKYASEFARQHNVILLLKGETTYITDGQTCYESRSGCAGMATAGSGDVLSGIIAAAAGQTAVKMIRADASDNNASSPFHDELLLAAAVSAYINGRAGEEAMRHQSDVTMIASDTARAINIASGVQ